MRRPVAVVSMVEGSGGEQGGWRSGNVSNDAVANSWAYVGLVRHSTVTPGNHDCFGNSS